MLWCTKNISTMITIPINIIAIIIVAIVTIIIIVTIVILLLLFVTIIIIMVIILSLVPFLFWLQCFLRLEYNVSVYKTKSVL